MVDLHVTGGNIKYRLEELTIFLRGDEKKVGKVPLVMVDIELPSKGAEKNSNTSSHLSDDGNQPGDLEEKLS